MGYNAAPSQPRSILRDKLILCALNATNDHAVVTVELLKEMDETVARFQELKQIAVMFYREAKAECPVGYTVNHETMQRIRELCHDVMGDAQ